MPSNIEIKAKLPKGIEVAENIAKSVAQDQKIHQHLQQRDTFFHSPNGRLKLREENDRSVLIAYQRTDSEGPARSDYVLSPVSDPVTMTDALKRANGIKGIVEKDRKVYLVECNKVVKESTENNHVPMIARVHLDQVKGLGDFIEFEVIVDKEDDVDQGTKMATALIKMFDIQPDDLVHNAYMDQILNQG